MEDPSSNIKIEIHNETEMLTPGTSIRGVGNIQEFIENAFKLLINTTKSSNRLPFGSGRDLYESYPCFHNIMKRESNKVLAILGKLMRQSGCRPNIGKRDDEEKTEMIVEANDNILEKVGRMLDEISGICKYPQVDFVLNSPKPISGSWNVTSRDAKVAAMQTLTTVLNKTKTIEKPQLRFKDKINNERNSSFVPKIKYKHNLLKPLALIEEMDEAGISHFSHPYQFELEHFSPPKEQLTPVEPVMYKDLEKTPLTFIDSVEQVKPLVSELKKYKEIAIDLEHHSYRSFQGFTCLMQISTRDSDYVIDTLALRNDLEDLNEVLTDPSKVKILHGADSDILWLQRDLGLYIVNMFDTHQAAKLLNYPYLSLAYLMRRFCNVNPEKHFQLADWRIRPLPEEFITYARSDTHYLLYIYDELKNSILEAANGNTNLLESVISRSTDICLKRYVKPVWNEDGYLDIYHISKKLFDNRQKYALKCLFDWRDKMSRSCDESIGYVLPNHMMLHISETLPREAQGILACCNPIPVLVRQNLLALHQIILRAREQPLVKPVFEEESLYRSVAENDLATDRNLRCPHDTNHEGEFRDDLPVLTSTETDKNGVAQDERLVASNPIISVFERVEQKPKRSCLVNVSAPLTPYQRYKLTKPYSETQEAADREAQQIVATNKQKMQEQMEMTDAEYAVKKESADDSVSADKDQVSAKNEPEPVSSEGEVLRKRKARERGGVKAKKLKMETSALAKNPRCDRESEMKVLRPEESEGPKREKVQPFNYSSVNFGKYQTYSESGSKREKNPARKRKFFKKKNNRLSI